MQARICTLLKINTTADSIPHGCFYQWFHDIAVKLLPDTLMPSTSNDPVLHFHRTFLHIAYLYINAVRWENGPAIITHWTLWLSRFIATGCKNYSVKSVHYLTKPAEYNVHVHNYTGYLGKLCVQVEEDGQKSSLGAHYSSRQQPRK